MRVAAVERMEERGDGRASSFLGERAASMVFRFETVDFDIHTERKAPAGIF